MKGTNEMTLNEQTLVDAMQEYFDKRITPKIVVKSVKPRSSTGGTYSSETSFTVLVQEAEAKPA